MVRPEPLDTAERSVEEEIRRAAKRRREANAALPPREPSELEQKAARLVSEIVGEEVDARNAHETGYRDRYHGVSVAWRDFYFFAHFTWGGGDHRYSHVGSGWVVSRKRRGLFGIRRKKFVSGAQTLADLEPLV